MGPFETEWLTATGNLSGLSDLSGQWIDTVHERRPPGDIVPDMDSSVLAGNDVAFMMQAASRRALPLGAAPVNSRAPAQSAR